ncbi:MAG: hypothetical protein GX606_03515 [Elusimicrobia bacterium]|nr:hypothetical protein [Elusimicrobiota bacterium]
MTIRDKIKDTIRQRRLTLTEVHRRIASLFEDQAIAYMTLYRTVTGKTVLRESTLYQIASALDLRPDELKAGTDRADIRSIYRHNEKAFLEMREERMPFLAGRLVLLPGGRTQEEQDPEGKGVFTKWVYLLQGRVFCVIRYPDGEKETFLRRNDSLAFDSTRPHFFENRSERKASLIVVQSPKYI